VIPESIRIALLLLVGLVLAGLGISYLHGCAPASSQAVRVQSAVTVLAEVVDPAYGLAVDGCVARERFEVAAERDGGQAPEQTDKNLKSIRARCDEVTGAFRTMRGLLAGAEAALDDGNVARAQAHVDEVRELWAKLKH
jgi:hypothetical protein